MATRICGILMLSLSAYEDVRERKVSVLPIALCTMTGLVLRMLQQTFEWEMCLIGIVPGVVSLLISKVFNDCIGMGDILIIMCVGILNGLDFCFKFIVFSCISIFTFSVIMMIFGKLHKNTQIACVPFFILGYMGAWLL